MAAAVGAALLHGRALPVLLAALHAGCCKATGLLRGRTVALLHPLYGLEKLTARETLVVLLGKQRLRRSWEGGEEREKIQVRLLFKTGLSGCKQPPRPVYFSAHESPEQQVH